MSTHDRSLAVLLNQLVPIVEDDGDWGNVLRDAHTPRAGSSRWKRRPRRGRLILALAAIAIALLVAIPALAVARHWWFVEDTGVTPISEIVVIDEGRVGNAPWYLTAFVSREHGICVGVVPKPEEAGGALRCGDPVRGVPGVVSDDWKLDWVGYGSTTFHGEMFVWGPADPEVARVDVLLDDGRVMRSSTTEAPGLDTPFAFYSAHGAPGTVSRLVAYDADGRVLERWTAPWANKQ